MTMLQLIFDPYIISSSRREAIGIERRRYIIWSGNYNLSRGRGLRKMLLGRTSTEFFIQTHLKKSWRRRWHLRGRRFLFSRSRSLLPLRSSIFVWILFRNFTPKMVNCRFHHWQRKIVFINFIFITFISFLSVSSFSFSFRTNKFL